MTQALQMVVLQAAERYDGGLLDLDRSIDVDHRRIVIE
jgi:hypothetical protein